MSCYSASIHLWMNEILTVGLQPFKLWMNCFSGMVGFFFALCYVELLWWSNVKQSVPMEHIAIFTCYADMKLTSVYSGKGFVFIRTFSFFFFAAAAAPAWTIVLGYCNHSFNLVYLFSRYTFVVVAQKSAAASSTSSPSRGHLSLSLSVVVNHPYFIGEKWCCCRLLCCRATFIMLGLVAVQRHITTFAIRRECQMMIGLRIVFTTRSNGGMAPLLYWASSFVLEKYFWPNFCFFSCIFL